MEAARIEWERIESVFVEDQVYENINAPQWVDLSSPLSPSDDVAWFCRPDCKHPTTADDFVNSSPPSSSKLLRSVSVSKLIGLVDWTRREAHLKRRGALGVESSIIRMSSEDAENQDPNFSTPNRQIHYLNKAAIKSSAGKDEYSDIQLHSNDNTQSGKDLFGRITEFCSELKKMATRPKEEDACNPNPNPGKVNEPARNVLDSRLPLVEMKKDTYEGGGERSMSKKKNKIKRGDGDENIPVCVNLNNMKRKEEDKLMVVRTNPPTPQGFSAAKTKAPNTRLMEGEMDQEKKKKRVVKETMNDGTTTTTTLDVFWFLKPCTTLST